MEKTDFLMYENQVFNPQRKKWDHFSWTDRQCQNDFPIGPDKAARQWADSLGLTLSKDSRGNIQWRNIVWQYSVCFHHPRCCT